jgi:aminopeptidase N
VVAAAVLLVAGAACSSTPSVTTGPLPESELAAAAPTSAPEALYPLSGTRDYDVERYDLDLTYDPASTAITSYAVMTAVAAAPLTTITLDLGPLAIDGATVDGAPAAAVQQSEGKLHVTPAAPIAPGTRFSLAVAYHGVPQRRDDGTLGGPVGWISTPSGSYTSNQPDGASTWLPANDRPGDKALTRLRITVPDPFYAVANGVLAGEDRTVPGKVSTTWDMAQPMAPSELEVAVGSLVPVAGATPAGLPMSSYVAANGTDVNSSLALAGQVLDFYVGLFGPYPFGASGVIAGDLPAGVDVDAQSRPLLSTADLAGVLGVRQHRVLSTALAHQWFGAAVTPARWQDVWLADGFTTYARWLWMEHAGLQRVDDAAANALARTNELRAAFGAPDRPTAGAMSSPAVADGGAVALHALRQTVGDEVFFTILRTWVADHLGASATTEEFVDHASKVAGEDLTGLFMTWLSSTSVPDRYPTPSS